MEQQNCVRVFTNDSPAWKKSVNLCDSTPRRRIQGFNQLWTQGFGPKISSVPNMYFSLCHDSPTSVTTISAPFTLCAVFWVTRDDLRLQEGEHPRTGICGVLEQGPSDAKEDCPVLRWVYDTGVPQ